MSAYRGATVRAIDPASAAAIYDLRLLLEPEAVRRAVPGPRRLRPVRAGSSPAGLGEVQTRPLRASDAATDQAQRSLANREFHRALYLACGNSLLLKTLDDLRDKTALVSALSWEQAPSWKQEAAEHQAILAAARRRCGPRGRGPAPRTSPVSRTGFPHACPAAAAAATEWSTDEH